MLRKSVLALAAVATLGAAALAPTSASAWHKHHGHGFGFGFYPSYVAPLDCYWVKKITPFGVRLVKVCSY